MGSGGDALWHYLGSFIFYTLLAIGLLYGAYGYLKKNPQWLTWGKNGLNSQQTLKIESILPLEARKNLYVVCVDSERFLLATSLEGTQYLAKLQNAPAQKDEEALPLALSHRERKDSGR